MKENDKQALYQLDVDNLVSLIENYADIDEFFNEYIEHYIKSEDENYFRLKKLIENIEDEDEYTIRNTLSEYFRDIELLIKDPKKGIQLITNFYDNYEFIDSIFEKYLYNCDEDSQFFSYSAQHLFFKYVRDCKDREYILDKIIELIYTQGFETYFSFVNSINSSLSKDEQLILVSNLINQSLNLPFIKYDLIADLAKQIPNGDIFEKAIVKDISNNHKNDLLKIAEVYCAEEKYDIALSKLKNYSTSNYIDEEQKIKLYIEIYKGLKNTTKQIEYATTLFENHPTLEHLKQLAELPISYERKELINKQIKLILNNNNILHFSDNMKFLFDIRRADIAEKYFYMNIDKRGSLFWYNNNLINNFLEAKNYLIVSILYRDKVDNILNDGNTKAYDKGVYYLRKLEAFSNEITDWKGFPNHYDFFKKIKINHGRKYSFWNKYSSNINNMKKENNSIFS
jgi:hypothetical protein